MAGAANDKKGARNFSRASRRRPTAKRQLERQSAEKIFLLSLSRPLLDTMECYTSQFLALAKSCSPKSNFAAATAAASLPFLILMCQYRELTAKNKRCRAGAGTVLGQLFATEPVKYPLPKWHKETMTPAESGKRRHLQPHDSDQLHTLSGWWETLLGISN
jgi:hypothetical protein